MTPEVQQQPEILKTLQAQGVPQDQWTTVLSVVDGSGRRGDAKSTGCTTPIWLAASWR